MRRLPGVTLLALLCAGCGAATPPPQDPASPSVQPRPASAPAQAAPPTATKEDRPSEDMDKWKLRPIDHDCRVALAALAAGALDQFHGLGRCGRVDAEGTLGTSGDGPSQFEPLGEYRVFQRAGGSVLAWFLSDDIRVVELLYPKLDRPLSSLLGAPEVKVKSALSPGWDQWVYAARGLTAHVSRKSGEVVAVFAYRPTTVEAFLRSDIARVSKSEAPLEELK